MTSNTLATKDKSPINDNFDTAGEPRNASAEISAPHSSNPTNKVRSFIWRRSHEVADDGDPSPTSDDSLSSEEPRLADDNSKLTPFIESVVVGIRKELARNATPQSTYRLQLDARTMRFRQAAEVVEYLHDLGVSHIYTSPDRKARSGSTHGYAIVDYEIFNPDLGGDEEYRIFLQEVQKHGMKRIPDIVPNHMSAAPGENLWWTDVLENGPSSPFASFFDIDWEPVKEELKNRVLLPMLSRQYGNELEEGNLKVVYQKGAFGLQLPSATLPLDPKSYLAILARDVAKLKTRLSADSPEVLEFESICTALEHLPDRNNNGAETARERQREKEVIKRRLAQLVAQSGEVQSYIDENLKAINGVVGQPESFDELDRLLDAQAYRLAHWKAAGDEINYRRFFDVNELAAVCTEDPAVFEKCHAPVFEMLSRGEVSGVRIDHIDGLFDPTDYLWKLQQGYVRSLGQKVIDELTTESSTAGNAADQPQWPDIEAAVFEAVFAATDRAHLPLFVEVEKILGPEEPLPVEWPIAGTTGYDFLRLANGICVDWSGVRKLQKLFGRFIADTHEFRDIVYQSKRSVLRSAMSSELQLLTQRLNRLSERQRRYRDYTLNTLRNGLREIIACFSVYRTYLRPGDISARDRRFVVRAVAQAKRRNPELSSGAFDFIRDALLFEEPTGLDAEGAREREFFVSRFQQVSSPVMAKGVEDTSFYRYFPLASLNEVGDDPAARPVSVEEFHRENVERNANWPDSMICTTTHDTKRTEDARARINVLSEIPDEWAKMIHKWARLNRRHHSEVDGSPAPSRADEYLFYQSLLAIWPFHEPNEKEHQDLVLRLQAYMEKATHEAKLHTSWVNPNADYDAATREFVGRVLARANNNRFLASFTKFHSEIARVGLSNSLCQLILKLTAPGIPDIYQGQELWDFSLVDPDNRRPVDFELRRSLLAQLKSSPVATGETQLELARRLANEPENPQLKLYTTLKALELRREHPKLFALGQYTPVSVEGAQSDHVCAFTRHLGNADKVEQAIVVVTPRCVTQLLRELRHTDPDARFALKEAWTDTHIVLPIHITSLRHLYTGQIIPIENQEIAVSDVFADFPVAILISE